MEVVRSSSRCCASPLRCVSHFCNVGQFRGALTSHCRRPGPPFPALIIPGGVDLDGGGSIVLKMLRQSTKVCFSFLQCRPISWGTDFALPKTRAAISCVDLITIVAFRTDNDSTFFHQRPTRNWKGRRLSCLSWARWHASIARLYLPNCSSRWNVDGSSRNE
jgi:hypothetical protein